MIAENYKSHLKNKNADFLAYNYSKLKKNKIIFEKIQQKSKLVKMMKF